MKFWGWREVLIALGSLLVGMIIHQLVWSWGIVEMEAIGIVGLCILSLLQLSISDELTARVEELEKERG